MSAQDVELRLARLKEIGASPGGVPLCMLPDPAGLYGMWSDAHDETQRAWAAWRAHPGSDAYCAYRAAADREECAQQRLAAQR